MMMEPYSPKSSPRGARSPSVSGVMNPAGQMEGGNLKLSIALGQKPTIIQKGPFYLMKQGSILQNSISAKTFRINFIL
jgi:mediator of RNA polymerase II transcription subunit 19